MTNAPWQCSVCEAVNLSGQRVCGACGAAMTRRSSVATAVRGRIAPVPPVPDPALLSEPVRRAINREPVDEEWPYDDNSFRMIPVPGGCIMVNTPRRRRPSSGPR